MKRKPANKKTSPTLPAKPLGELGESVLRAVPKSGEIHYWSLSADGDVPPAKKRTEIAGVPLPPDLEPAVRYYARVSFESLEYFLMDPPPLDPDDPEPLTWKPADIPPEGWHDIRRELESCFRQGFYLALLRYADDLKQSAEAAPLIDGLRKAARKGADARRAQAAPAHRAIRKRFRELRKTVPKKTARYLRVAEEFKMSDRHIAQDRGRNRLKKRCYLQRMTNPLVCRIARHFLCCVVFEVLLRP